MSDNLPESNNSTASGVTGTRDCNIPEEVSDVLNELPLPEEDRKMLSRMFFSVSGIAGRVSPEMEVSKKITPSHIDSILKSQDRAMDYSYKNDQHKMIAVVIVVAIVVAAIIVIIAMLKDSAPEAMSQILTALISATVGGIGGYGFGSKRNKGD